MKIIEYGNRNNPKLVLIHGFESPITIWDEYIAYYQTYFHIFVLVLPGHGSQAQEKFVSFQKCAQEFEDYYLSNYQSKIFALYGMSMGGLLATTIWQNQSLVIENLILESSPLTSYGKLMTFILTKQYLKLTHKAQKRDPKIIAQASGTIISPKNLDDFLNLIDNLSDENITNYIKAVCQYKLINNIKDSTKIYYFHGDAFNEMIAKKTAKYLLKNYPLTKIKCLKNQGHCMLSLLEPKKMIKELDQILLKNEKNLDVF